MGANSKIEWTDHTFNPWVGCTKVSPGCENCYAESWAERSGIVKWGAFADRRRTRPANWNEPRKWNVAAAGADVRPRVFCASLADWLDAAVPVEWLADLLALIRSTPNLDWLLLSKRPQNWRPRLAEVVRMNVADGPAAIDQCSGISVAAAWLNGSIPANIWVGTTVEDQPRADQRIPLLLSIPARVRFLSCEPLLGPVEIDEHLFDVVDGSYVLGSALIHWVICGGESGPKSRAMHPDWARSLRTQCSSADIPFLFKQWGEWLPEGQIPAQVRDQSLPPRPWITWHRGNGGDGVRFQRFCKHDAGRLLDGVEHNGFPVRT